MTLKFKHESFSACSKELAPLFQLHWEEIARNRDVIKLDVDWDKYAEMSDAGAFVLVTARTISGELVGYTMTFLAPSLHYKSNLFAVNDILYLRKDFRGAGNGKKMILETENILRALGADVIHISMKTAHDFGGMLESIGYSEIERTFEKRIIGGAA